MRKLVFLILFLNSLYSQSLKVNLVDFALHVSKNNNVSILVDDSIREHTFSFFIEKDKNISIEAFKKALLSKNLRLEKYNKFYFVSKIDYVDLDYRYRTIKLNFVNYEDIKNFINIFQEAARFEFIKTSKLLLVHSNSKDFEAIKNVIKQIDTIPKQYKLKVTILETNLDNLKNYGNFETNINIAPKNTNFFFNLLAYPFSVKNNIPGQDKSDFYSFIKYVHSKNLTEFHLTPTVTLTDSKEAIISSGQNLPFLNGETNFNNNSSSTTNSYEYRDVGIRLYTVPHFYSDGNAYLDLELDISNVVSNNNNLPITNKKYIRQSIHLSTNELVVLTGLNRKEIEQGTGGIPLLQDIPFLGWLFKYETNEEKNSNFTIVLELIDSRDGF
ncbi:type II secretion system protein GspD [Aliarcobacter thereius]|uniref:type II secretion system protein GspD n=1 Tax=Aliarcobacter thereius TaxID=544718 RepID=UPI000826C237|nr:hypothetical protein [Aliarcobacter thereius]OCL90909.1 Type II secretion system protein D precursor [Aliarcobacter thereius]